MDVIPFKITVDDRDVKAALTSVGNLIKTLDEEQRAWEKRGTTINNSVKDSDRAIKNSKDKIARHLDDITRQFESLQNIPTDAAQQAIMEVQNLKEFFTELRDVMNGVDNAEAGGLDWWEKIGGSKEKIEQAHEAFKKGLEGLDDLFKKHKDERISDIKDEEKAAIEAVQNQILSEEEKEIRITGIKKESAEKQAGAERDYKQKQKKLQLTQAIINTAVGVTQALGGSPPPMNFIMAALVAALGAAEIAVIAKQKFARGGVIPFADGGAIQGAAHAQGGIPFMAGGRLMEAEGGELIVNKGIWSRPDLVHAISEMNAATGGKRFFASGGVIPVPATPSSPVSLARMEPAMDMNALVQGLRGVLAEEVGSLQVTNNVVNTSAQQVSIINQQAYNSF